ncbi:MAG TPA: hypothetical protein VF544_04545 [Pyrinomonadaceae bacterium]|jgi:hypothetical protein
MRNHQAGLRPARILRPRTLLLPAAPVVLILASATTLLAQRPPRPAEQRARSNQAALNEWRRTHMKEELDKQFKKKLISLMPQIKEDFTRIQIVNNAMMRRVFDEAVLDYKDVSGQLGEIRKRASRLRENLMLPENTEKEAQQKQPGPAVGPQLKDSLLALDTLIMGFVKNPLFQKPGVIDARLSAQAGRDLKTIIEFSSSIRKEVEKLSRLQPGP